MKLKNLLPLATMFIPGLGPLGAGLLSGGITAATTGDIRKGLLAGLLTGGLSSGLGSLARGAEEAAGSTLAQGAGEMAGVEEAIAENALRGLEGEYGQSLLNATDAAAQQAGQGGVAMAGDPAAGAKRMFRGDVGAGDLRESFFPKGSGMFTAPGSLAMVGAGGLASIEAEEKMRRRWEEEMQRRKLAAMGKDTGLTPMTPMGSFNYEDPYESARFGRTMPFFAEGGVVPDWAGTAPWTAPGGGISDLRQAMLSHAQANTMPRTSGVPQLPPPQSTSAPVPEEFLPKPAEPLPPPSSMKEFFGRMREPNIFERAMASAMPKPVPMAEQVPIPEFIYEDPREYVFKGRKKPFFSKGGSIHDKAIEHYEIYKKIRGELKRGESWDRLKMPKHLEGKTIKMDEGGIVALSQGRFINGPGDGTSDSIPAMINGNVPAALSDGEFVIPANAVAAIGNGSNRAGAQKLQRMIDRVGKPKRVTLPA